MIDKSTALHIIAANNSQKRIDEVSATDTYIGYREDPSVLVDEDDELWSIVRIIVDGTVTKLLNPDGKQTFTFKWSDRTTYTYL